MPDVREGKVGIKVRYALVMHDGNITDMPEPQQEACKGQDD
jgi:hypothetical protein